MKVKVEVYKNKFVVFANGSTKTLLPIGDFTTSRLIIGDFEVAEKCLKDGFEDMGLTSYFRFLRPSVDIYQKEMCEGGLSAVERRVLLEVSYSAGAKSVTVVE